MLSDVSVPILVHQLEQLLRPAGLPHELLEGEPPVQVLVLALKHPRNLITEIDQKYMYSAYHRNGNAHFLNVN